MRLIHHQMMINRIILITLIKYSKQMIHRMMISLIILLWEIDLISNRYTI